MIFKIHKNPNTVGKNSSLSYISNEKKNNNQKVENSNLEYLQNDKNHEKNEERELWYQGKKCDQKDAQKRIERLHQQGKNSITIVLSPSVPFTKKELLEVENQFKTHLANATNSGVTTHAATHTIASDPSHNHLHIIVTGQQKTIDYLKNNYKMPTLKWKKSMHKIEENVAHMSGKKLEKSEYERQLKRLTIKSHSGSLKRYSFIAQHVSKTTGNLSLLKVQKSMKESVKKGNMTQRGMDRFQKEIKGVLNTLEKEKIAVKKDENHYTLDVEKFAKKYQKIVDHHAEKGKIRDLKEMRQIHKKIEKLNQNQQTKGQKMKINYQQKKEFENENDRKKA